MYLGDFTPGAVVRHKFFTEDPTGAPITLAGTPAAKAYRDGSTSTEVTTGITLTVDFDALTGLHEVAVDTGADGTFYATAHDFYVILAAGTVNGVSVIGKVLAHFSLGNRSNLSAAGVRSAVGLASANLDTQLDALPTNAELAAALGTADDAVLTAIGALSLLDAAGVRAALGLASANLDTQLSGINSKTTNLPSDPADQSLIIAATDAIVAAIAALNVSAIKLQTDKLTFNGSNQLAVNLKRVNDVTLTGDGTSGTPWGPA